MKTHPHQKTPKIKAIFSDSRRWMRQNTSTGKMRPGSFPGVCTSTQNFAEFLTQAMDDNPELRAEAIAQNERKGVSK